MDDPNSLFRSLTAGIRFNKKKNASHMSLLTVRLLLEYPV